MKKKQRNLLRQVLFDMDTAETQRYEKMLSDRAKTDLSTEYDTAPKSDAGKIIGAPRRKSIRKRVALILIAAVLLLAMTITAIATSDGTCIFRLYDTHADLVLKQPISDDWKPKFAEATCIPTGYECYTTFEDTFVARTVWRSGQGEIILTQYTGGYDITIHTEDAIRVSAPSGISDQALCCIESDGNYLFLWLVDTTAILLQCPIALPEAEIEAFIAGIQLS